MTIRTMSVSNQSEGVSNYKQFRLTLSDPVLIQAIDELQRKTGLSEKEIAEEGIIRLLEEKEQIRLE